MKLRTGILVMLLGPLLALVVLGSWTVTSEARKAQDGFRSGQLISEAVALGALVHQLQVERGQSAGYLASQGRNFAQSLPEVRDQTLAAHAALAPALAAEVIPSDALRDLRQAVTAQDITGAEMAKTYTAAIRRALALGSARLGSTRLPKTVELGDAIVVLADAKEWAGLQRAAGAGGLGAGQFALPVYQAFLSRGAAEAGLLQVAEPTLARSLGAVDFAALRAPTGIDSFRNRIIEAGPAADLSDLAASDWFAASTRWIEALHDIEIAASDHLAGVALMAARHALVVTGVVAVMTALAAAVCLRLGVQLLRRFDRQIAQVSQEMALLAEKKFTFSPHYREEDSEIGQISRSLDAARAALEAAETANARTRTEVLSVLEAHLDRLAAGDLTAQLSEAFPQDYERIRSSYNAALKQLSHVLWRVQGSVDEIREGAVGLNTAATDLARRTETQAASLEQSNAALEQIAQSARNMTATAQAARQSMDSLKQEAAGGVDRAQDAMRAMDDIVAATEEMTSVVKLISDLAFQTNLLALNAGVEAARAGEAGRGFAVVAAEVRSLALRAGEAATEIRNLISRSHDNVREGVSRVEESSATFRRINDGIATTTGSVVEIAEKAEDQSRGVAEIRTAVQSLDELTQNNAATSTENSDASTWLSREADRLTQLLGRFKMAGGARSGGKRAA